MKIILTFLISLVGCGGEIIIDKTENIPTKDNTVEDIDYCGNDICEKNKGENYWNCFDCVDLFTGAPKDSYCGDGICFKETMTSCWTDCKPRAYNPNAIVDAPKPGQEIKILLDQSPLPAPLPTPGPLPGPPIKDFFN